MNKNNSTVLIYIFIISLLELILTFLIKYDLNSISVSDFNFFYIGNLLPLGLEIILIFFVFGQFFNKQPIKTFHKITLFVLITSSFGLLLTSYLANKLGFQFADKYFLSYPFERVIPGAALMLSFFIKLFLITLLLNLFFNNGYVVYLKSFLTTLFIFIIAFTTIYIFTTKNGYSVEGLKPSNKTIAVVLGAAVWDDEPSPLLKGRIKKADKLIKSKKISHIQFTGSNAPGEISEAKTAYNFALSLGIKKHLMSIEEETTTTTEQIKYIKKNLSNNRKYVSILVVSDQFHLTRVLEICKFFDVKAIGVASDYTFNSEKLLYYRLRESIALLFFWLFAI